MTETTPTTPPQQDGGSQSGTDDTSKGPDKGIAEPTSPSLDGSSPADAPVTRAGGSQSGVDDKTKTDKDVPPAGGVGTAAGRGAGRA